MKVLSSRRKDDAAMSARISNGPIVRRCLLLICLLLTAGLASAASAAVWYVRTDGGSASQCTGKTDAGYPGHGTQQDCAFNHPYQLLPPNGSSEPMQPTMMRSGDTLQIRPGSYMMGYGAPGQTSAGCDVPYTWDCEIGNIPSGIDAAHPTVIMGDCKTLPELWGTQRAAAIFSLRKVHDVKIACLDLTDHANCIENYQPTSNTGGVTACNRSKYPYGTWAANGIYAADMTNLTLQKLDIHGFADYGINAGRLSGNTLLDGVTLRANGWGGWSGDLGGNDHTSSSSGTIVVQNSVVAWNGCSEAYPSTTIVGCWGQNEGGYGDGFAEAWTGGDWTFVRDDMHDNTQDGLDLLYANGSGTTLVMQSRFYGNAGNQMKISGPSSIVDSIAVGNCMWTQEKKGTSMSGAMQAADDCRALGATVELDFPLSDQQAVLAFNTVTGQGDGLIDASQKGSGNTVVLANNILDGRHSDKRGDEPTFGYYGGDDNVVPATWIGNLVHGVRHGACPGDSVCEDPLLRDPVFATYDPAPRSGSPAIGTASPKVNVRTDYYGRPRPQPMSIGAVEYLPVPQGDHRPLGH